MSLNSVCVLANAVITVTLILGTGYVVFGLGHSPWWFVAALVADLATAQYVKSVSK